MEDFVGVDLGATNISVAVGTVENVRGVASRKTPSGPTGIDVTEGVLETVREACSDAGIDPGSIAAGGIGSFGPFDLADGAIVDPANVPDVERIPLTGPLGELINSEDVYLHNDTTAGLIGERFVASESPADMVYLTLSTGIGAGVAVDGHLLSGWDGNAGEVGHFPIDSAGQMRCGCGRDGHWEAYASGAGIPRYAQHLATELNVETTMSIAAPDFSAADVFAEAGNDELADIVIERVGRWNALGLATLVHAYAPIVVVVGGAVALHNTKAILGPMRRGLDELVMTNIPEIRSTALGEDVVVLGALASAMTDGTGTSP